MDKITIKLREEFIKPEELADHHSEVVTRSDETEDDSLYLTVKNGFVNINISYTSEELRTRFADFCDDLYFLTDAYKLTGGQIPAGLLFSRGDQSVGLYLHLRSEFFEVEVD